MLLIFVKRERRHLRPRPSVFVCLSVGRSVGRSVSLLYIVHCILYREM